MKIEPGKYTTRDGYKAIVRLVEDDSRDLSSPPAGRSLSRRGRHD